MAGLGGKNWTFQEEVTSSDVNGYLADQVVMRFGGTANRDAGFGGAGEPTLAEGMVSYLDDANRLDFYDGSAWKPVSQVLQVVSTTKTDTFSTTSATFSDVTGLSVSITPSSTTSKIFIQASGQGSTDGSGASGMRLLRNSTDICIGDTAGNRARITNAATSNAFGGWAFQFLDSPSTTSATTYKIQIASLVNSRIHGINRCFDDSDFIYRPRGTSTITVMEIAG